MIAGKKLWNEAMSDKKQQFRVSGFEHLRHP
jgi:hypothetical protein